MSADAAIATIALIILPSDGSGPASVRLLGRSAAERQAEFALACGCREIIALGFGASPEAIALRHWVERMGLAFRILRNGHALARVGLAGERLLVLSQGLMPDPGIIDDVIWAERGTLLTFPASKGVEAGFERIDLDRAWAGALVLPGALVPRLYDLPDDVEVPSALLRIALQAGLGEARLNPAVLVDTRWCLPRTQAEAEIAESRWLQGQLTVSSGTTISRQTAFWFVRRYGGRMLNRRGVAAGLAASALALLLLALALCHAGWVASGFLGIALAVPLLEAGQALAMLNRQLQGSAGINTRPDQHRKMPRTLRMLRLAVDVTLLVCGWLALSGDWLDRLFAPLVLLVSFHVHPYRMATHDRVGRLRAWHDQAVAAALVALFSAVHSPKAGLMLAALLGLGLAMIAARGQPRSG